MAITNVAIMVKAAPVTFELMSAISANDTLPHKNIRMAPIVAGMASLIPLGRQKIKTIVKINENIVNQKVNSVNYNTSSKGVKIIIISLLLNEYLRIL